MGIFYKMFTKHFKEQDTQEYGGKPHKRHKSKKSHKPRKTHKRRKTNKK